MDWSSFFGVMANGIEFAAYQPASRNEPCASPTHRLVIGGVNIRRSDAGQAPCQKRARQAGHAGAGHRYGAIDRNHLFDNASHY
jgi:hypothetical protein